MLQDTTHLELINVTDRKSIDFTRLQTSDTWKGILSVDDYMLRERVLNKKPHFDNILVFILFDGDVKVCSCELFLRDGIVFENGQQRTVSTGCITAVCTYKQYRGRGYAKVMTDKVVAYGKKHLDGFIFLYSEVGEYYSRSGFKSYPDPFLIRQVTGSPEIFSEGAKDLEIGGDEVKFLEFYEFKDCIELFQKHKYEEYRSKSAEDGKPRITIDVNEHRFGWFHLRAKYINYKVNQPDVDSDIDFIDHYDTIKKVKSLEPFKFGLTISDDNQQVGFIIWTYDWKTPTEQYVTILTMFTIPGYESYKGKLVSYLEDYLKFLKIPKLIVWASEIDNEVFKGEVSENTSIPAIQMVDDDDDVKLRAGEIIWENCNKIPFC